MGDLLSKLFVPLHSLPGLYDLPEECLEPAFKPEENLNPSFGGVVQLLFLGAVYGRILFGASRWIANGSELLLLIPEIAPVVGSVVLPILGAVPDGAIVLFSGLGTREKAQKQLSVGVGALAGSTIMLLTLPWAASIYGGRVNINENGRCNYRRPRGAPRGWKKLDESTADPLIGVGVEPNNSAMVSGARIMLFTSFSYFLIQGAAFALKGEDEATVIKDEHYFALTGLVFCMISFLGYLYLQLRNRKEDRVLQDVVDEKREEALKKGMLSLQGAFFNALDDHSKSSQDDQLLEYQHTLERFEAVVRKFFKKYDVNDDGSIDAVELKLLLEDLHIPYSDESLVVYMKEMDGNNDGVITFQEFVRTMAKTVSSKNERTIDQPPNYGATTEHMNTLMNFRQNAENGNIPQEYGSHNEEVGEEEEEEVPEDIANLPPEEQRRRILLRAFYLMGLGTLAVLLFSDPMVEVLSEIGEVFGVPAFYVSFMLAPLASNASEILASFNYARKKTSKTITISLTSLEGAAIMNNTFCLGIFLALIYFRRLEWSFSAETIAILFVEFVMYFIAITKVQTVRMGIFVATAFPLSILIVLVLENGFGLD